MLKSCLTEMLNVFSGSLVSVIGQPQTQPAVHANYIHAWDVMGHVCKAFTQLHANAELPSCNLLVWLIANRSKLLPDHLSTWQHCEKQRLTWTTIQNWQLLDLVPSHKADIETEHSKFWNPEMQNKDSYWLQVLQEEAGLHTRAWWELALCTARLSGALLLTHLFSQMYKGKLSKLSLLETCFARSLTYAFQPVFGLPARLRVLSFVVRSGSAISNTIACYSHCLTVWLYSPHHTCGSVWVWACLCKLFTHHV